MIITHKLTIDMARLGVPPRVDAMQGDTNTRNVEIALAAAGVPWEPPDGTTAAVAFLKPDGTKGLYDKLPDGTVAASISGNVVTATLAPQVLTVSGSVVASIIFYDSKMNSLATFPFSIIVARNPGAGEQVSNNYYTLQNLDQVNQAFDDLIARLDFLELNAGTVKTVNGVEPDVVGNVQFDWVANKTKQEIVLLQEISVSSGTNRNFTYETFEGYEEVVVTFDDAQYVCAPEFGYAAGDGYFVQVGNKALVAGGEDTGEPFLIWMCYKGTGRSNLKCATGEHTMSITGSVYTYAKLPEEYLPELNSITLKDQTTGKKHKLYVNNGKLTMEVL